METKMLTMKYKGMGKYNLQKHATFHRRAYASLENCSSHVNVTLPNEQSRVSLFLNSIDCDEPKMVARVEFVRSDSTMLKDFNKMANYLLPACPISTDSCNEQIRYKSHVSALDVESDAGEKTSRKKRKRLDDSDSDDDVDAISDDNSVDNSDDNEDDSNDDSDVDSNNNNNSNADNSDESITNSEAKYKAELSQALDTGALSEASVTMFNDLLRDHFNRV